jgi:hypothetical protein
MTDVTLPRAISIGDTVRIRSAPATEERGLSGLLGTVYGQTTPSVTAVEVIGDSSEDYAVNVSIDKQGSDLWFVEELLELVARGPQPFPQLSEDASRLLQAIARKGSP